ncbi:MAG: radical SAM-associated putative lipoprotein [Bacteroidales bacterium]|nr:radical SAM-associated putative lipoprotein [Bacteroidales bacterium]
MQKHLLRKYNKLIAFFITILGVSNSCINNGEEYGVPMAEYGMPLATYKVHGIVSSKTSGQAVNGIEVSMQGDTTITDVNGNYAVEVSDYTEDKTYILSIRDVDSTHNGSFADKDTLIDFKESELTGGNGEWDGGVIDKNINIKIETKL